MLFRNKFMMGLVVCGLTACAYANNASSYNASSIQQSISPKSLALASDNGAYIGVGLGHLWSDWSHMATSNPNLTGVDGTGGFNFGLDLGYQWNQYIAAEFGYVYFPSAGNLSAYATYLAGKLMVDLPHNVDIFAKAGIAYHDLDHSGDTHYFNPVFACGFGYAFIENLSMDIQYMYFAGDDSLNKLSINKVPRASSLTVGLTYNLSI